MPEWGLLNPMELWPPVTNGAEQILKDRRCPACGSTRTHRSHAKGRWEGAKRALTPLRPFVCSDCRWRGWRVPIMEDPVPLPPLTLKPGGPGKLPRTAAVAARRREALLMGGAMLLAVGIFVAALKVL